MSDKDFGGAPLPKGMSLPDHEPDEADTHSEPLLVTSKDVNYVKLIREALDGIEGVSVHVLGLGTEEERNAHPVVHIDIEVRPRVD